MIQTTEVSITYKGDGVQTSFPYPYPYRNSDDIVGYIINDVGYEKRITNNFKYDKVSNIYQYPLAGDPLAAPYSIKLIRETPQQQNADLPGKLPFSLIEKSLDWIIMILQEIGSRCNSLWHIRNDCKLSETNARNSASAAAESEENAANSENLAKKWAMSPVSPDGVEDTSPTGYTQSAKVWAALSKEYAGLSKFKLPIGYYKSVAEMKASETAIVGRPCVTLGYYEPNDGGSGVYIIRQKKENDVDNGGSIIVLDNENVAELIIEGSVNVKQFGAKGDGVTDDTEAIRKSFINYNFIFIPKGTYLVTKTLTISKEMCICGETMQNSILKLGSTEDIPIFELVSGCIYPKFKNLEFMSATKDASLGIGIATEGGGWNAEVSSCSFTRLRIGVFAHAITGLSIHKCYFLGLTYGILFSSKTPTDYSTTTLIDIRYTTFQYCNPALKIENESNTYAQLLNLLCLSCDFERNTQSIDFKGYRWNYTFINCWFESNTTPPKVSGGTWIGTMFQGDSYTTEEPTIRAKASTYIADKITEGISTTKINLGNGAAITSDDKGNILSNNYPCTPYFISYRATGSKLTSNIPGLIDITKQSTGKYIVKLKDKKGNLKPFGWLQAITMVATAFNPALIPLDENKEPIFPTSHYYIDVYGTNITDEGSYYSDTCAVDSLCVATYSDNDKTVPVDCNFTILLLGYTNHN